MESVIDIRKEENVIQQLESVLNELLYAEQNNAARTAFLEATRGLKPESCNVKTGWSAGQWIAFNCTFQKNGNSDIIKEIVKGMTRKTEDMNFIFGLNPNIFHFDSDYIADDSDFFYCRFKLIKE